MSVTVSKINLLPVSEEQEDDYLLDIVLKKVKEIVSIVDEYGSKYEHEVPWLDKYLENPKFYLYRIRIGAIGRINSCESAAKLGLLKSIRAKSHHFTSMALYYVFRIARLVRRDWEYMKTLDKWMNSFLNDINSDSRYLEYLHAYGKEEEEEES